MKIYPPTKNGMTEFLDDFNKGADPLEMQIREKSFEEIWNVERKVSNCCSAPIINGICGDCKEHCDAVTTE